jgi:DNA-binding IscR family transcriptional regulator
MQYVEDAINRGYNVLLADADIVWTKYESACQDVSQVCLKNKKKTTTTTTISNALDDIRSMLRNQTQLDLVLQSDARPNIDVKKKKRQ